MNIVQRIVQKPRSIAAREWLFQIHLYTGLIAGLYAVLISVTGSALVFQPQFRDWQDREFTEVAGSGPHISVGQALAAVQKAHPDFHIMSIRPPATMNSPFRISAQHMGGNEFFINPFTGVIIGQGHTRKDFVSWLQQLHFNLLSGKTGRLVNGVGGLMLVLLSATGLVIWWPGVAGFWRAMNINWRARWERVNYDIHSSIGFFTLAFTLVISLTGAYYAWPEQTKDLVSRFSPMRQRAVAPRLPARPKGRDVPVDLLVENARKAVPGAWVSMIMLSHGAGQPVKVTLMNGGAREYQNANYVYLDPWTGDVVRVDAVSTRSAGDAIVAWIGPLHFGTFGGGTPLYVLWMLLGLSPAVLGVSGILMWWNRVAVKQLRKFRAAKPVLTTHSVGELEQVPR